MNILVVDDDSDLRNFLAGEIHEAGYGVGQAANGVEAVLQVLDHKPDAVVMDIRMPKLDGVDALRILRHLDPALPVIMLTGQAGQGDMLQASQLGALICLLKPVPIERLLEILADRLRRSDQPDQGR